MAGSELDADVVIIGGGPAGLAAAIAARKKGFEVVVADGAKPPIEKPCGEGMLPDALTALQDLGVVFDYGEGHPFQGIAFLDQDASAHASFVEGIGLGLCRPLLHERLIERAQECGVRLLWESPVASMDGHVVKLSRGMLRAKWIIGADGNGSRVRHWSGLEASTHSTFRYATRRRYCVNPWSEYMQIYWGSTTQAYVTPMGPDEVCVVVMSEARERACFDNAFAEFPGLEMKLRSAKLTGRERGAVTAMRSLARVQRNNVALIGDASGGVDAITGEGLRLAFRQAFALADAMIADDLKFYQRAHRCLLRRPRLTGHLMLWLGRNPGIRLRVIRAMQHNPELFSRLLAAHTGKTTPTEFLSTGAWLGWQLLSA